MHAHSHSHNLLLEKKWNSLHIYTHSVTHSLTGIITFLSLSVAVDGGSKASSVTVINCVERTYLTGDVTGNAAHWLVEKY